MSILAETLRGWAQLADKITTEHGDKTMEDAVPIKRFAALQNQVMALEMFVQDHFRSLERMISVVDARQAPVADASPAAAPKAKRASRKSKAKTKTVATKRKRRSKAQMLADAAKG